MGSHVPHGRTISILLVTLLLMAVQATVWAYVAYVHHDHTPYDDEIHYHRPAIDQFVAQFPHFDFSDYPAAMTPGYHVTSATLVHFLGHGDAVIRATNIAWSLGCVAVLVWVLARRLGWLGLILAAPLLASPYFNFAAIWLRPDNSAWLMVLGILVICLSGPMRGKRLAWASALLTLLVFFRHAHIWCAALLWAAAFADPAETWAERARRTAIAIGASLPAFAVLAYFVRLWHGLVPPRFKSVQGALPTDHSGWQHVGPNWSVPVIVIGLLGVFSLIFLPFVFRETRRFCRDHAFRILLAGLLAGAICTIPLSSQTPLVRNSVGARYSGLWNIAGKLPTFHDRSPFMIFTCLLGGMAACIWIGMLPVRWRWIMGMALVAFLAAQIANAEAWQKYYEPYLLIWLPLATLGVRSLRKARTALLASSD